MSSSPIDELAPQRLEAETDSNRRGPGDIRPRGWIKRVLPRTMFGRALLIVVLPVILLQAIATWVFYDRHWAAVSWRLSTGVAGDIALMIEAMHAAGSPLQAEELRARAGPVTDLTFTLRPGVRLPPVRNGASLAEEQLTQAMLGRVAHPFRIDAAGDGGVRIDVQLPQGVLTTEVPRNRLYSSTTYIFVMWMVGSSLVLLAVAAIFLRNQVKSLRRLAAAADSFGKGQAVPFFKIEGAVEIRRASVAFLTMRDRIQRQVRQRTQMLAGVSHDLRAPLTRMKLALEILGDDPAVEEIKSDVVEMERMVDFYLDFVRGEGSEAPVETDISLLLEDIAAAMRRDGTAVTVTAPLECAMTVRPHALRRCLNNLIGNAQRHGSGVWAERAPGRGRAGYSGR